jgi:hypothetical protein
MVAKNSGNQGNKPVRRKLNKKVDETETVAVEGTLEIASGSVYCRKCQKVKRAGAYFSASDRYLDANGYMSICKECVGQIYSKVFQTEHTIERAILRVCRMLNLKYSEDAIVSTINQLVTQKKDHGDTSVMGIYKGKLAATQKSEMSKRVEEDLTFVEPLKRVLTDPLDNDDEYGEELSEFWGEGLNFNDYAFLEKKLAEWKQSYSCQNKAEEFYLKEICYKELELQKARVEDRSTDPILKSMNDLLSKAALTPQQTNAASSGKSGETWGIFIKTIEETTPAEYFEGPEKELFKDYDNIGKYLWNYVTRPIKNFIQSSKDYNILDEDGDYEEPLEDGDIINGNESSTLE